MRGTQKILLISLRTAGAAVGFGFPSVISEIQDFQIERQSELLDADTIRLTMKSSLTMGERLLLVNYYSSSVVLDSGQNMTDEEAKKQVIQEMEKFADPIRERFQVSECDVENYNIYLRMTEDESASSLVIWDFWLRDQNGDSAEVMLDDETGKILGISCYSSKKNSLEEKNSVEGDGGLSYGLEAIQMTLLEYFSDYYQDVRYQDSYLPGDSDQDLQYMDIYPSGDSSQDISYNIVFEDSEGSQYEIPVLLTENSFFFNL